MFKICIIFNPAIPLLYPQRINMYIKRHIKGYLLSTLIVKQKLDTLISTHKRKIKLYSYYAILYNKEDVYIDMKHQDIK